MNLVELSKKLEELAEVKRKLKDANLQLDEMKKVPTDPKAAYRIYSDLDIEIQKTICDTLAKKLQQLEQIEVLTGIPF